MNQPLHDDFNVRTHNAAAAHCPGPVRCLAPGASRRSFMRMGIAGFASLSLPGVLRLQAASPNANDKKTAVIMVWKPGGCSHIDTYDPKPNAGTEYRGPFGTIPTKISGVHFTELLPMQANIADKQTVLRSMHQTAAGHPAGSMQLLSATPILATSLNRGCLTG